MHKKISLNKTKELETIKKLPVKNHPLAGMYKIIIIKNVLSCFLIKILKQGCLL